MVATRAASLTANRTWQEIGAARDLFAALQRIAQQYPPVAAIWLADPAGLPRLSSRGFPPRAESVANEAAFLAHSKREAGPVLGRIVERRAVSDAESAGAREIEQPALALTRRITATDGSFGGMVAVVLDSVAVTRAPPPPFAISPVLVAADGHVLPDGDRAAGETIDPARLRARGATEADGRIVAYRAAGEQLFVGAAASTADVLAEWRRAMLRDGALLALALAFIAIFAAIAAARAAEEARLRQALAVDGLGPRA
jgi:hypothetical protein